MILGDNLVVSQGQPTRLRWKLMSTRSSSTAGYELPGASRTSHAGHSGPRLRDVELALNSDQPYAKLLRLGLSYLDGSSRTDGALCATDPEMTSTEKC